MKENVIFLYPKDEESIPTNYIPYIVYYDDIPNFSFDKLF